MTTPSPLPGCRQRGSAPIPDRYTPQLRPTPTMDEATAVIAFVYARLAEHPAEPATIEADLIAAIADRGGLLDRYRTATRYATSPPNGLEDAWALVAATLASIVGRVAALWPNHPDYSPRWNP